MKTYTGNITAMEYHQIFVFGSNTQGRHGRGAAKWAHDNAGAMHGKSKGIQGKSYAIVTKDLTATKHPSIKPDEIVYQIMLLYLYAKNNPQLEFLVAYKGRGSNLNGYTPTEMAAMFNKAGIIPDNIVFEDEFAQLIRKESST